MGPARTSVIVVVVVTLAGGLVWVSPAQAETAVLLAEVPTDPEGTPTDPEECGALDYGCRVTVGVYLWIAGLVGDLIEFTLTLVALPALATPPPSEGLRTVWGEVLTITNSLYVLVVIVAGVLLMGYQTVQTSAALKDLLPRVVLGFIAANASWLLIEMMRELANGVAVSMLDGAATLENVTATLTRVFDNPLGEALVLLLLMLIGALLSTFWMLAVIIRVVLWIVLTAISPLALACHALPQTEGLARLWWRSMGALMIIQIAQGLVLRVMVVLFLSRDAMPNFIEAAQNVIDVLLIICLMYVLIRIPFWAFKHAFNYQNSPLVKGTKLVASLLIFRGLGKAFAAKKGTATATRAAASRQAPPRPSPPRSVSSGPSTGPARRWYQPELPDFSTRLPYRQDSLPGIDRRIDRREQARLRERRRYYQPTLTRPSPPCQEPLPGWSEPEPQQDPLPGARNVPPRIPLPRQDALFDPPTPRPRPRRRR